MSNAFPPRGAKPNEPIRICGTALIEPKCLVIKIPKQVERLNANVSAVEAAPEQAPEVLNAVSVDFAFEIRHGMVNHFMFEIRSARRRT